MASRDPRETLHSVLRSVLRPAIKLCLKRSLYIQDLLECAKQVYIEQAEKQLQKEGIEVTISRLRVMTGIHRKDVIRIYREGGGDKSTGGYVTGVIGQWVTDTDYLTSSGKPRVLSCDGEESEFNQLVRSISTDVHPNSVLFELERIGAVQKTQNGIRLRSRIYLPKGDPVEIYRLYGRDSEYLMRCVEENAFEDPETPNLHLMTEYDNISVEDIPRIKQWLLDEGSKFHKRAREFLSKFDLDINPSKKKRGGAVVNLGAFGRAFDPKNE